MTIWSRCRPATNVQLPLAMSLVPSGLMSNLSMLTVPLRGPVKARLTSAERAPVTGSTAARALRATPLAVLKVPPM
ncbi:MAG TPA: hypothetical protein VFN05_05505 [Actinomycetes bacterium]|nr:hypothetical protein [Actinomycetes bacterium]